MLTLDLLRVGIKKRPPVSGGLNVSGIEAEQHHIAVMDDVFLAFVPCLAGFLRSDFAIVFDVVFIGDGLGTDKAALEIGMDDTGSAGSLVPRRIVQRGFPSALR